jgi:GNAT superfamily N-acetyltransferase
VHDGPDALWVMTSDPSALFNSVHRARFAPADVDLAIEDVKARARALGVRLMWFVGPSTRPADLATSLQAHGFVHDEDVTGIAMDLSRLRDIPLPPGLDIREVDDEQDLRTWCDTMVTAFEMPGAVSETYLRWALSLNPEDRSSVHFYIARLDGVPVATHLLVLSAGAAGVHFLGTLPTARGKGVGTAVACNTFREGRTRGYRVGVTEVEAAALEMGHRLGFKDYYTASTYIWRGEDARPAASGRSWKSVLTSAVHLAGRR